MEWGNKVPPTPGPLLKESAHPKWYLTAARAISAPGSAGKLLCGSKFTRMGEKGGAQPLSTYAGQTQVTCKP